MPSPWVVMRVRYGRIQRLSHVMTTCGIDSATHSNSYFTRQITSRVLPPTTNEGGGQERDPGVYHLTQLFGKFLKSGKEEKAAELMEGMTSLDSPATVAVCNYLLNSCSKSRNPEMAKEVWNFMETNGVQMNTKSYGSMLCALTRGGFLEEAVNFLHVLFKKKEANVVMYNTVLNGCTHAKSKMYAARCVQLMEQQGVAKDELTYVELIKLSGMRGDLDATKKWWKELNSNFAPNMSTRSPYIIALCRMNALADAHKELLDMASDLALESGSKLKDSESGVHPTSQEGERQDPEGLEDTSVEQAATHEATFQSQNLEGQSVKQSSWKVTSIPVLASGVLSLGPRLPKNFSTSLKHLQNAFNSLINAAGKAGDHLLAESIFAEMRRLGLKTDIYTYNALLRAVVDGRGISHGLRIFKRMEAAGLKPDVHSLTALLEGYCENEELDKAEDVLKYMEEGNLYQKPSCFAYNILLKACAKLEDPMRALHVFARMKEAAVAADSCTYLALLTACGNTKIGMDGNSRWSHQEATKRVAAIEMDMAQSGVEHTPESLTTVMAVLGAEGLTDAVLQRLQDAKCDGKSLLDAASFNTVILSCINAKQVDTGWDIYHQMRSSGVKPDVYTYNILINGCARDRSLSTAFELVDSMRQEGLNPDVVTFNSLLKVVCHSGEMDIVLDLLQKMRTSGVKPDSATFNTILASASFHKRIEITEFIVEEMRRQNVFPDQHTLLPVVSMYMHVGQINDAVGALRVLGLRMLDGQKASEKESKTVKTKQIQDVLGDLARENLDVLENTRDLLLDAVLNTSIESLAKYIAALTGLVDGDEGTWVHEQSPWAARLSAQYDERKTSSFVRSYVN